MDGLFWLVAAVWLVVDVYHVKVRVSTADGVTTGSFRSVRTVYIPLSVVQYTYRTWPVPEM